MCLFFLLFFFFSFPSQLFLLLSKYSPEAVLDRTNNHRTVDLELSNGEWKNCMCSFCHSNTSCCCYFCCCFVLGKSDGRFCVHVTIVCNFFFFFLFVVVTWLAGALNLVFFFFFFPLSFSFLFFSFSLFF